MTHASSIRHALRLLLAALVICLGLVILGPITHASATEADASTSGAPPGIEKVSPVQDMIAAETEGLEPTEGTEPEELVPAVEEPKEAPEKAVEAPKAQVPVTSAPAPVATPEKAPEKPAAAPAEVTVPVPATYEQDDFVPENIDDFDDFEVLDEGESGDLSFGAGVFENEVLAPSVTSENEVSASNPQPDVSTPVLVVESGPPGENFAGANPVSDNQINNAYVAGGVSIASMALPTDDELLFGPFVAGSNIENKRCTKYIEWALNLNELLTTNASDVVTVYDKSGADGLGNINQNEWLFQNTGLRGTYEKDGEKQTFYLYNIGRNGLWLGLDSSGNLCLQVAKSDWGILPAAGYSNLFYIYVVENGRTTTTVNPDGSITSTFETDVLVLKKALVLSGTGVSARPAFIESEPGILGSNPWAIVDQVTAQDTSWNPGYTADTGWTLNYYGGYADSTGITNSTYVSSKTGGTVLPCGFVRQGYTFKDWNTSIYGTGTTYKPGDTIPATDEPFALFAQWTENKSNSNSNNTGNNSGSSNGSGSNSGNTGSNGSTNNSGSNSGNSGNTNGSGSNSGTSNGSGSNSGSTSGSGSDVYGPSRPSGSDTTPSGTTTTTVTYPTTSPLGSTLALTPVYETASSVTATAASDAAGMGDAIVTTASALSSTVFDVMQDLGITGGVLSAAIAQAFAVVPVADAATGTIETMSAAQFSDATTGSSGGASGTNTAVAVTTMAVVGIAAAAGLVALAASAAGTATGAAAGSGAAASGLIGRIRELLLKLLGK